MLCKQRGRFAAAPLFARAVAVFEERLPAGHPKLATCRDNYRRLREAM